jgi:cystathionine beta-lyase/cystathionine gamma-synthase
LSKQNESPRARGIGTRLVHAGGYEHEVSGAVVMPIHRSAMYEETEQVDGQVLYLRYHNTPDQRALAARLAVLEGTEDGVVLASGMAAISSTLLSVLRSGDHLLAQDCLYGGTHTFFTRDLPELGIEVDFVQGDEVANYERSCRPNTRAVYLETLANPLLHVTALDEIASWASRRGLVSIVDNTMATPLLFRPHEHGFDLSLHSATKYLNGHSDLVGGVVLGSRDRVRAVRDKAQCLGGSLDPAACYLLARGVKTLQVRMERASRTAEEIAAWLTGRPSVRRVHYPGLPDHPSHERARRLLDGWGALLAFEVEGRARAQAIQRALGLFTAAPSFGGVESLITRPLATSHSRMTDQERARRGIADGLLRVSVGLEDVEDLIDDLARALASAEG